MRRQMALLIVGVVLGGCGVSAALPPHPHEAGQFKLSKDEQTILDLTNEARQKEKLPPLKPNPILFKVARGHSANMAKKGEMKHELDGKTPAQRVEEAGYDYRSMGENVAYGERVPIKEIFQGWMDSPGHRANILNAKFKEIGIGIAQGDKEQLYYYTQVFGTLRKQR